jgi:hypothetical protein
MTTSSLILILNVTMLLVNATVSSIQSLIIWRAVKRDDK